MNEKDEEKKPQEERPQEPQKQEPVDGLPKTQEELDALLEKRLARERKKLAKQPPANAQPPAEGAQPPPDQGQMPVDDPEKESLNRELLLAKAQLTAVKEGVDPAVAEDAVYLALRQAEQADEADEDGVREALKAVLKRHPEWKKKEKQEESGGFRFGADAGGPTEGRKKALPTGKVIF